MARSPRKISCRSTARAEGLFSVLLPFMPETMRRSRPIGGHAHLPSINAMRRPTCDGGRGAALFPGDERRNGFPCQRFFAGCPAASLERLGAVMLLAVQSRGAVWPITRIGAALYCNLASR